MCNNHVHSASESASSRRRFLGGAAALAALASSAPALAADDALPTNRIGGDAALQRLTQGNARYVAGKPTQRDYSVGRVARTSGQKPFAAILGCADSRVAPELAFDQGPGDLFVVRLAGNFVNDDALASLEFATKVLEVPLIMVLGHTSCGAVAATIQVVQDNASLPGHLPSLTTAIRPAVEAAARHKPADLLAAATAENVRQNVARLMSAAPILADLTKSGAVKVVGGVYDLATGKVGMV
ncbi:carbonic anhydrase [Variovorax sp. KK3]|uniref:carbonic anhydrase n=1 Tax=Variovorax sp. KK3 TaxID=1855728 RepID=UPI00097BBA83|nr:carbonic anhydrase [Variovorax sp. KK3]